MVHVFFDNALEMVFMPVSVTDISWDHWQGDGRFAVNNDTKYLRVDIRFVSYEDIVPGVTKKSSRTRTSSPCVRD